MSAEPITVEQQPPLLLIPPEVVKQVAQRSVSPEAAVVFRDYVATISRIYDQTDQLPTIGEVKLHIDYRQYHETWPADFDALHFRYDRGAEPLGVLEFEIRPTSEYRLSHRYVQPEYQGRRIVGNRLLAQAEHFFQELAKLQGQPVILVMQLGQVRVLRWALRNGFQPRPESAELVERVLHHPEDFQIGDIIDDNDGLLKEQCIFPKDSNEVQLKDTVRLTLEKVINRKVDKIKS